MTAVLYAALAGGSNLTSDLYTVDPVTAVLTSVGPIGDAVTGMAIDPTDGTLYGVTSDKSSGANVGTQALITIDKTTGAETAIGTGLFVHDIAFDATGQLWGINTSGRLYQIDKTDASFVQIGSNSNYGGGIDFDLDGVLWHVGNRQDNVTTIDLGTGAETIIVATSPSSWLHSGKFDSDGLFWASKPGGSGAAGTDLVTVDVTTGVVTFVATFSVAGVGALAWDGLTFPLKAKFVGSPLSGFAPTSVSFTDQSRPGPSGPITGWNWDFGDGFGSTVQNPTHTYNSPGNFTVTLTVTGTSPDGTDSLIKSHYVHILDPADFTLYAALASSHHDHSDLYTVDPSDASMVSIGPIGFAVTGLAFDPTSGILYGSTSAQSLNHPGALITIDVNTGAGTLVGDFSGFFSGAFHDIAFDATGQLWGAHASAGTIAKINKNTAVTTNVGGGGSYRGGLDFDPDGVLWKVGYNPDHIATLSTTNGAPTVHADTSDFNSLHSGKFTPDFLFWAGSPGGGGSAASNLVTVDVFTGTVTVIGAFTVAGVGGLAWFSTAPPPTDFTVDLAPDTITVSDGVHTLVHLNTHAIGGDTETITLSATAPGGFTVTFPDNPITAGDIDVPIDIAVGSPSNGTYTITIHCDGTDNSHDVVLTVHVVSVVPGTHIAA